MGWSGSALLPVAAAVLIPQNKLPLDQRRIAIAQEQSTAHALADAFIKVGARPIWCPPIQHTPLPQTLLDTLDDAVLRLAEFKVIVFASHTAVDVFYDRALRSADGDPTVLALMLRNSHIQVAAIGPALQRLRSYGIQAQVVPLEHSPRGLAFALDQLNLARDSDILVPVPIISQVLQDETTMTDEQVLARDLEAAGARIVRAPAFLTEPCDMGSLVAEMALFKACAIDAICIHSEYELRGLQYAAGDDFDCIRRIPVVTVSKFADLFREAGMKVEVEVDNFSVEKVVSDLSSHFSAGKLVW